ACARNPVSGRPEVTLVSEAKERELGEAEARRVAETMGILEDPALSAYVRAVGERLAQFSPRTDVTYTFQIVDMEEPNAFALPGAGARGRSHRPGARRGGGMGSGGPVTISPYPRAGRHAAPWRGAPELVLRDPPAASGSRRRHRSSRRDPGAHDRRAGRGTRRYAAPAR